MVILGIDTILHDICVAVMEGNRVLVQIKKSKSISLARGSLLDLTSSHIKEIGGVIKRALEKAEISLDDISLICANNSGSLLSNALIGVVAANVISNVRYIPIIDVEHQEAHIFSNWIDRDEKEFKYPILVFSASGGHSLIGLIQKNNFKFKKITESRGIKDNSKTQPIFVGIGTLFSDVIYWLELGNSKKRKMGDGNFISYLAKKGDPNRFKTKLIQRKKEIDLGCREIRENVQEIIISERKKRKALSPKFISDLAAGFEDSLAENIIDNLCRLSEKYRAEEIHLAGGVSANRTLREKLTEKVKMLNILGRYPKEKSYCVDNAVMTANLGYLKFKRNPNKYLKQRNLGIKSDLVLENVAVSQFLGQNKELK